MSRCPSGKRTYNKRGAKRACVSLISRGHDRKPHQGLAPYRCPNCGEWHLGHPRRKAVA